MRREDTVVFGDLRFYSLLVQCRVLTEIAAKYRSSLLRQVAPKLMITEVGFESVWDEETARALALCEEMQMRWNVACAALAQFDDTAVLVNLRRVEDLSHDLVFNKVPPP